MYQIVIMDKNAEITVERARSNHTLRVPGKGEHVLVKWSGETRICEVEDVWTHLNLDQDSPYQGAVQVLVRWARGMDPGLYVQSMARR
ncbi:hypothetical protein FRC96_12085 [Lujinxingia vulgaris]|uniref:Uncharacterized protein n=1 Tax=Lujinxingia vulgaris TaxID=2600176 RepID=A0A5C6X059_9DELT|nr:hypothetical protein [Lujinxingia vulgaris]TXD35117.1 hypothetical protein FRC96_12085 [Lujinxingia vulgaris]